MYKVIVKGRTYDQRDLLKRDGANWDKDAKVWYFLCNEQAKTRILRDWNDKERKVWAYVEDGAPTEASETPNERVVLWFKCTDIETLSERFLVSERLIITAETRDIAIQSIEACGRVYVDMNGNIRDPEGLTLVDIDEVRELDLSKDFRY